jgi:hypothetical protein
MGRRVVQGQPEQIVHETVSSKYPEQNRLEVWFKKQSAAFQVGGPGVKLQSYQKKVCIYIYIYVYMRDIKNIK